MFDPSTVSTVSTVTTIALKTSLLLVAAGLLARLMADRSAAWRHLLWTAALSLSLLMPLAVACLPSTVEIALPWKAAEPWMPDAAAPITDAAPRRESEAALSGTRPSLAAGPDSGPPRPWSAVFAVWLIGALGVGLRILLAHVGLIRWARAASATPSPEWSATLRRVLGEASLRRPLRVLETGRTDIACTWGFLRPVILLPAAGAQWPEAQRRFALRHELAHVRRFDYLTTQVASLACAVHWFNPLVWFAAGQARKLQELACDDVVLNAGGSASDYAGFLVSIAGGRDRAAPTLSAAVGMVQRSQLHGRVIAILDASRARLPMTGLALLVAVLPLAGLMLMLATITAVAAPGMQPVIPLTASFRAVELRNGGRVTLIHGESQRVTLLKGDPEQSLIVVDAHGRLLIDHCKAADCAHVHDFELEVATPQLPALAVSQGGIIQVRGRFPHQSQATLAVSQGGMIDVRTLPVSDVAASVFSGGRIFTKPAATLTAMIEQGGNVMYWGQPVVRSSIEQGGVVQRGAAADLGRPLSEMDPARLHPVPPVPPVAALPPIQPRE